MVWFVGAGPGAEDLITVRGLNLLQSADVVIYAGSLVNPDLLKNCKNSCEIYNSAYMTLEQVMEVMTDAFRMGKEVVRVHTGDPSLYGAVKEQMDCLKGEGIPYEVCPGVSSFCGAAAALQCEYTLPDVSQSVVITRMAGKTPVPEKESVRSFAAHRATMVLFLSAGLVDKLRNELLAGGYPKETPAAIVYKATWPQEKVFRCTIDTLAEVAKAEGITGTALIIVGDVLDHDYRRSDLYHPEFFTGFRKASSNTPRIYVIGMGPGDKKYLSPEAREALEASDVIVGYTVYVDLMRSIFPEKEYLSTPMRQEVRRCEMAFEKAVEGKTVSLICSGDAGIYGMAGPIYEVGETYPQVEISVISGITAASAGAALLGAPLMHDFAVISLSDLLTPWELIEERILAAAKADFCICLYNPASRKRTEHLKKACKLILSCKNPDTVCGLVRNIGRAEESYEILRLKELKERNVDMFTTVYIGNSKTKVIGGKMVTPRGYDYDK